MDTLGCRRFLILSGIALFVLANSQPASAVLTVYTDRAAFEALGTIVHLADFEEFDTETDTVMDMGWYHKGVTYEETMIIFGANDGGFGPGGSNVISDSFFLNFTGALDWYIDPDQGYNLFGFDVGRFADYGSHIDMTIYYRSGTGGFFQSDYYDIPVPSPETTFFGVRAGSDEQVVGFSFNGTLVEPFAFAWFDNVTLGRTSQSIPEPTSIALVAGAIATLAVGRNRRR